MKQKIILYVLLLLVCRPVAAEPINKPDSTTAAHLSISPKNVETIPIGESPVWRCHYTGFNHRSSN